MVSPTLKPDASLTSNEAVPDGTYESVIEAELPTVCQEPAPRMLIARWGAPVMLITVPPAPEPLPRSTTPPVVIFREPLQLKVPGASNTAPRNPFASGFLVGTASMAA